MRHSHGQSTSKRVKRKKRNVFLFEIVFFVYIKFSDRTESAVPSTVTRSAPSIVPVISHSKKSDNAAVNPWDLAQIWIESISKEEATRKQWKQMYGWMADLDAKVFKFYK